ncbi:unnamed protein product, partial [Trichogramma brassicae]
MVDSSVHLPFCAQARLVEFEIRKRNPALCSSEARFRRDPKLYEAYSNFMKEYIQLDHMNLYLQDRSAARSFTCRIMDQQLLARTVVEVPCLYTVYIPTIIALVSARPYFPPSVFTDLPLITRLKSFTSKKKQKPGAVPAAPGSKGASRHRPRKTENDYFKKLITTPFAKIRLYKLLSFTRNTITTKRVSDQVSVHLAV